MVNASISGAKLGDVDKCIEDARQKLKGREPERIILSLVTNDITTNKNDPEEVIVDITKAADTIQSEFPDAFIGIADILPRKGSNAGINKYNATTKQVNNCILKFCEEDPFLDSVYINSFSRQGIFNKKIP